MILTLPIAAPVLKAFADGRTWVLMNDMHYRVGDTDRVITVPKGFVTDFASIPKIFWSMGLSPIGFYSKAAIVHDWLYATGRTTRADADHTLLMAMEESGVGVWSRNLIYGAVRAFGWVAWRNNEIDRLGNTPRIIPQSMLDFGPTVLWNDYRKMIVGSV